RNALAQERSARRFLPSSNPGPTELKSSVPILRPMATGPQPYPSRGQRSGVPRRAQAVPSHRRSRAAEVLDTWRSQPLALRVLRAFLGLTFTYAGIQKFADPSFFDASSPQSIQSQLRAFAQGTPLRPVLVFLTHLPVLSGIGIAL